MSSVGFGAGIASGAGAAAARAASRPRSNVDCILSLVDRGCRCFLVFPKCLCCLDVSTCIAIMLKYLVA